MKMTESLSTLRWKEYRSSATTMGSKVDLETLPIQVYTGLVSHSRPSLRISLSHLIQVKFSGNV